MVFLNVVKALYTYESSQEDEISFQEDDILYVTEENDADWWSAVLKKDSERVHGLVPSNYFEQASHVDCVKCLYDYQAADEEELSFVENDTLYIYDKRDPDWWVAQSSEGFGFVPSNYCESIDFNAPVETIEHEETPQEQPVTLQETEISVDKSNIAIEDPRMKLFAALAQVDIKEYSDPLKEFVKEQSSKFEPKNNAWNVVENDGRKRKVVLHINESHLEIGKDKVLLQRVPLASVTKCDFSNKKNVQITCESGILSFQISKKDISAIEKLITPKKSSKRIIEQVHAKSPVSSASTKSSIEAPRIANPPPIVSPSPASQKIATVESPIVESSLTNAIASIKLNPVKSVQVPSRDYEKSDAEEKPVKDQGGKHSIKRIERVAQHEAVSPKISLPPLPPREEIKIIHAPAKEEVKVVPSPPIPPRTYIAEESPVVKVPIQRVEESFTPQQSFIMESEKKVEEEQELSPTLPPRPAPLKEVKKEPIPTKVEQFKPVPLAKSRPEKELNRPSPVIKTADKSEVTIDLPPKLKSLMEKKKSSAELSPSIQSTQNIPIYSNQATRKNSLNAQQTLANNAYESNAVVDNRFIKNYVPEMDPPRKSNFEADLYNRNFPSSTGASNSSYVESIKLPKPQPRSRHPVLPTSFTKESMPSVRREKAALPSRSSQEMSSKPFAPSQPLTQPMPGDFRVWSDVTGTFRVEAKFIKFENGQVHLHKSNGVFVAVPLSLLSREDVDYVQIKINLQASSNTILKPLEPQTYGSVESGRKNSIPPPAAVSSNGFSPHTSFNNMPPNNISSFNNVLSNNVPSFNTVPPSFNSLPPNNVSSFNNVPPNNVPSFNQMPPNNVPPNNASAFNQMLPNNVPSFNYPSAAGYSGNPYPSNTSVYSNSNPVHQSAYQNSSFQNNFVTPKTMYNRPSLPSASNVMYNQPLPSSVNQFQAPSRPTQMSFAPLVPEVLSKPPPLTSNAADKYAAIRDMDPLNQQNPYGERRTFQ